MGREKSEKELHFLRSRETIEEVSGWKMFIFLPQSPVWRFFMVGVITVDCIYNFTRAFYLKPPFFYAFVNRICDIIYCADVILSTMHFAMKHTRKLRHGKRRHAFFLVIDFISLLPLEAIYNNTVYNRRRKNKRVGYALNLVIVLRIYQIPTNFSNVKDSIYKVKKYLIVTIFQVLIYFLIITYFLSCFIFLYFDENQQKECLDKFLSCVVENAMETFFILSQCYITPFMNYPLDNYTVLLIIDFLLGYIFTYGFVTPLFLFVSTKFLLKYFEYSRQLRHIKVMTGNFIKNKKLRKKVLDYFQELRTFGRCDRLPELLDVFPLGLKKNIFCDMHWEAIRHSYLLQDISIGCKRSLALYMRTEFLLPRTKLFEKNINPTYFLYLESGLLQVMAEENSQTPVLNLSAGTVLGEISFYLYRNSLATVRAGKFSIIHTLPFRDFFRILMDYPNDKKMIVRKVNDRLKLTKSMHEIKTNVCTHFESDVENSKTPEEAKRGNIKWIKMQHRAMLDLKNAEKLLKLHQYTMDDYERQVMKLDTQMKHSSVYLPYICINDEKMNKQGVVCLKNFPWLMDPQCQFIFIWKIIIYVIIMITIVLYPAYIAFCPHIPKWFFCISCVITLIYLIDIWLQFTTAVRIKNITVQRFSTVFISRITTVRFIVDLLAAIPLQLFVYEQPKPYGSNLYFLNALLKLYLLVPLAYKLNYSPRPLVFVRTITKYLLFLIVLIYLSAAVFYLTGVKCILYDCGTHDWYENLVEEIGDVSGIECAFLKAVYLGYEIPEEDSRTGVVQSYIILWIFFVLFHAFYFALNGECTAAYVLELSYDVEYKNRMDLVYDFMGNHKMVGNVRNRVMATMQFHWIYDKNNYITDKAELWDALSENLKTRISRFCILPVISKSRLFESEDEAFLMALCRRFTFLVLPANSLLLTLGTQTSRLYIIQKGFVQINSFIAGDLHLNTSRRITAKEGDTFPVIDVFSQTPASVTAVTVTECELLVVELEDVLSEMIIHGIFKDFVESVRETDLSKLTTAKLGVSGFKDVFSEGGVPFRDIFQRLKGLGTCLKFILRKKPINSHSTYYLYWEISRVLFIIFYCIAWPVALGCCYKSTAQSTFFQVLTYTEFLSFVDFYIRLNVAYYNKLGIYVSHTLSTAAHYLQTAFIADLIAFSPNFHVWHILIHRAFDYDWPVIVIHIALRSFSLYRFVGYLTYLKVYGKVIYRTRFIIVVFFVSLCIHYYICLMVYLYLVGKVRPKFRLTAHDNLDIDHSYEYYFNELGLLLALGLRSVRFLNEYDFYVITFNIVATTLGLIGQIWLFSHLTLTSTTSNKNLTTYQYYMQSFVNYLSRQRAEEKIINQAVEHFEYEWQEHMGNDVYKIFTSLPQTLHEDITYPLYKRTFGGVVCLSTANEYFYRTLSRLVQEVYLKEGTVIIFHKEVQSNIFFLHSGLCSIDQSTQILYKGAIIGDIKAKGMMKNTIATITPVKLLKIPSKLFFMTLNNFYNTKRAYEAEVAHADDYLVSIYIEDRDEFAYVAEKEEVECEFVPYTDEQEAEVGKSKKLRCYMNYDSKPAQFFRFVFMIVAYITVIIIPVFMAIRVFTPVFLSIIYLLDLIWLVKIIMVPRMITQEDAPIKHGKKLRRFILASKIIFHAFTVLPIELIPLAHFGLPLSDKCCFIMCMCYVNRMLRMLFIFIYFKKKGKRLLVNFFMNVFGILMLKIALINISCAVSVIMHEEKVFEHYKCYKSLNDFQRESLLKSYLCVLNYFIGAGMNICLPEDALEVFFQTSIALWGLLSKAFFINHVLMIIYVTHHNKSNQMVQLERLDNYLSVREVSPVLRSGAQKYFCNLLNSFYEGADTLFLNSAPSSIRTAIMQNIYLSHLKKCFLFRDVDEIFLKQLTTRLYLNIFFPGDYIAEKGDVDHNMYFIQKGEVYCIQTDLYFKALEKATDLYTSGASFGIQQGIFSAFPHNQTYRAKTLTSILVLNFYRWEDLRIAFPEVFDNIYKLCLQSNVEASKHHSQI